MSQGRLGGDLLPVSFQCLLFSYVGAFSYSPGLPSTRPNPAPPQMSPGPTAWSHGLSQLSAELKGRLVLYLPPRALIQLTLNPILPWYKCLSEVMLTSSLFLCLLSDTIWLPNWWSLGSCTPLKASHGALRQRVGRGTVLSSVSTQLGL